MRAILMTAVLLAGCGGDEEVAFEPNAVSNATAEEASAIADAEAMLDNKTLAPAPAPEQGVDTKADQ